MAKTEAGEKSGNWGCASVCIVFMIVVGLLIYNYQVKEAEVSKKAIYAGYQQNSNGTWSK
jgi:hypothetical protein